MSIFTEAQAKAILDKVIALSKADECTAVLAGAISGNIRFALNNVSTSGIVDNTELAANPVHLMYVLEQRIAREDLPEEAQRRYLEFIKGWLAPRYAEFIGKEISCHSLP